MLTLRRRGKFWHVRGTVRVGKEVREVAQHTTGCREREAAEAYRHKLETRIRDEILHGGAGRARHLSCAEVLHLYLERPEGLHPSDVWRLGELGDVLGAIAAADVATGWDEFVRERCAGLAPATVDRFRATLRAALRHVLGKDAPDLPAIRYSNQRLRWLPQATAEVLTLAYAAHARPIVLTLRYQGARTQEALQLQWPHVDLDRETLFFDRSKNGEPRTVQMHARVWEAIAQLWLDRGEPTEGHVFLSSRGRPYADTREYKLPGGNPLRAVHGTACRRARVRDFTVHDWRHHAASWWVMSGVDLPTVQRLGGWKDFRSVLRYAAVSTDHMAESMKKVAG